MFWITKSYQSLLKSALIADSRAFINIKVPNFKLRHAPLSNPLDALAFCHNNFFGLQAPSDKTGQGRGSLNLFPSAQFRVGGAILPPSFVGSSQRLSLGPGSDQPRPGRLHLVGFWNHRTLLAIAGISIFPPHGYFAYFCA